jgi:hypothetical protein
MARGSWWPITILAWAIKVRGLLIAFNEITAQLGALNSDEQDAMYVANKAEKVVGAGGRDLPTGAPAAPQRITAEIYEGDAVKITWQDASDNEIGFRVQRTLDGSATWTTVAYRPPQIDRAEGNPPAWIDFLAPPGVPLAYRVVAISETDNDQGASEVVPAVTLHPTGRS